jgi:Na+/H+-dicarboxylate symporter
MTFFGNIFASSYKHYLKQKRVDPYFQAKLVIAIYQSLALLLFLLIVNEYFKASIFSFLSSNKLLVVVVFAIVVILNFRYYTTERMQLYIENFNSKCIRTRRVWAFITGLMPIILLGLFFLVLRLKHPVL